MNTDVKCSIIEASLGTIVPNRGAQRSNPSVHREEARRLNTIHSHFHTTHLSTSSYQMRQDSVLLALVHESVRMLPVQLALCDLEAPGWGEPWFPHCAFFVEGTQPSKPLGQRPGRRP